MKNLKLLMLAFSVVLVSSCKSDKEENATTNEDTEIKVKYVVKPEATTVKWTAYKTTEKKGVGGEFITLDFDNKVGASPEEALNDLKFSIPIRSLVTKDVSRDAKIKASFFGAMLNTSLLSGTIKVNDGKYFAALTMNGTTNNLPLEVTITDERRVSLKGVMNLEDWNALDALASLNKVCYELHKGADGISKTWEDVAIEVNTYLRKN